MPIDRAALLAALRAQIAAMQLRRKCKLPFTHFEKSVKGYTKLVKKLLRLKYEGGTNCQRFVALYTEWLKHEVSTSLHGIVRKHANAGTLPKNLEEMGYALFNYKFGQKAPDEKLYASSRVLQCLFPRGVSVLSKDGVPQNLFFGIPKFSGASKDDDDDLTGAKKTDFFKADNFLTPGKSLKDVRQIFVTEKSNGENAKVGLVLIEGKVYLWSGSKQTVTITDPEVDPELCGLTQEEHSPYPGNTIAQMWWNYWNSLSEASKTYLEGEVSSGNITTIMGEINTPWSEHLVPITTPRLDLFTFLGKDGIAVSPRKFLNWCDQMGIEEGVEGVVRVQISVYNLEQGQSAPAEVERIKKELQGSTRNLNSVTTEGYVLYLTDAIGEVVQVVKVKSFAYTIVRGIREAVGNAFFRLGKKQLTFEEVIENLKKRLLSAANKSFLAGWSEDLKAEAEKWALAYGQLILEGFEPYSSVEEWRKAKIHLFRGKFATMWRDVFAPRFEELASIPWPDYSPTNDAVTTKFIELLNGSKSRFRKEFLGRLKMKKKNGKLVTAEELGEQLKFAFDKAKPGKKESAKVKLDFFGRLLEAAKGGGGEKDN